MKYIKLYENFEEIKLCPFCLERYLESITYNSILERTLPEKISSLQISVPLKGCINNCKSCIAKISINPLNFKDYTECENFEKEYIEKLKIIKEKGCKNVVITSDKGEPLQNKKFLQEIGNFNKILNNYFNFEIQTTGVLLNNNNLNFLKNIGIKIISVSVFDIFNDKNNLDIIDVKEKLIFSLNDICKNIKDTGFILRLSINLINTYNKHTIKQLFNKIEELNPDQVTFKNLWYTEEDNPINNWIKTNKASNDILNKISNYLDINGYKISNYKYSFKNKSIWLIDNCMIGNYVILRNDANLYRSWIDTEPVNQF